MWSVNPGLAATAPVNKSADEEGYNTPIDQVYLQVASLFSALRVSAAVTLAARRRIGIIVFLFRRIGSTLLQP